MSASDAQTWATAFAAAAAAFAALAAFLQVRQTKRSADISLFHLRREIYDEVLASAENFRKDKDQRGAIASIERCARNSRFIFGEPVYSALTKLLAAYWKAVSFRDADQVYSEREHRAAIASTESDFLNARSLMEGKLQLLDASHPLAFVDDFLDWLERHAS